MPKFNDSSNNHAEEKADDEIKKVKKYQMK